MDEGLPKLWLTARTLALKARHASLGDAASSYAPIEVRGPGASRLLAYLRGGDIAVIIPTRAWQPDWTGTTVRLPDGVWTHVLADATMEGGDVDVAALLAPFPVALLERR
jgi:(1->4)-alpha-D-glucan 1-alpha-D-glucosylmutase